MNTDHLKKLAIDATPGPWSYHDRDNVIYSDKDEVVGSPRSAGTHSFNQRSRNGFWIAAANPAAVLELIAEVERLKYDAEANRVLMVESRQNDYHAMAWLADCRFAVGDDGKRMLPEFVEHLKELKRQRDELLAALRELRSWYEDHTGLPACNANSAIANAERQ